LFNETEPADEETNPTDTDDDGYCSHPADDYVGMFNTPQDQAQYPEKM
jgi:hypothetical protein